MTNLENLKEAIVQKLGASSILNDVSIWDDVL